MSGTGWDGTRLTGRVSTKHLRTLIVVLPTPPFWLQTAIVLIGASFRSLFHAPARRQQPARLARPERALTARDKLDAAIARCSGRDRRAGGAQLLCDPPDRPLCPEARDESRVDESLDDLDAAAELVSGLV